VTTAIIASKDSQNSQPRSLCYFVGIDLGYREHVVVCIPFDDFNATLHKDKWKRSRTLHFTSDAAGFRKLDNYLDKFSNNSKEFLILLEPTGGYYGLTLLVFLISKGYLILQVENKAVKDYREKIFGSETKTDDTDSRLMARMGFLHEVVGEEFSIQPVNVANPDDSTLRVMVRDYLKIGKEITRRKNQLQQVVAVTFPELKSFFLSGTAKPVARALLEKFPTPQELSEASEEEVAALLSSAGGYKHAKRVGELLALAQSSAGVKMMVHHQWRQGWIIKQLPILEKARDDLVEQINHIIANHPYTPIIESLPTKSTIWTATLIATIGNIDRFSNYGEFKAYMGWFPSTAKSGTSLDKTGLAHKGVRLTRNVLGRMALVLIAPNTRTTPFREFYEQLVARRMKPATAVGHLAGKISVVLYGMLKTMTPYDEKKHRRAMGLPEVDKEVPETLIEVPEELVEDLTDENDDPDEG
jgi:transposase